MATRSYRELLDAIEAPQHSRQGSLEEALAVVDALPRGRALDVPCGPGRMALALDRLGFAAVAADLDPAVLRTGALPACLLDLDRPLPFADAAFTLIYCGDGIEHLENPFGAVRELARILDKGGVMVVVTPNYLNVERRLQFLLTGSLAKPPRRAPDYYAGPRFDRGHISPLTLTRLAYAAENAGLELVEARTVIPRKGQRWLAPLALLVRLWAAFTSTKRQRDLFAEHTQTLGMLLGGKQLLAVFRKHTAAREVRPA